MAKELWKDEYFEGFDAQQYPELKQAQDRLEQQTSWEDGITKLSVIPLSTPMDAEVRSLDPLNTIPKEVLLDTCDNAGIMLSYLGKEACLRDCAMPSLLTTTGISGTGVSRVDKENLAAGLSAFLTGSRSKSKIMTRAGKVSAVLSQQYEYMPISSLLDICDGLEATFGPAQFRSGAVAHDITVAEFRYPNSVPAISAAYGAALQGMGRKVNGNVMPIVQFRASDTSNEAAKLVTYLQTGSGDRIPLGGIKVPHVAPLEYDAAGNRISAMEKFRQEAATLFSKMEYDMNDLLPRMLSTTIDHPGNTLVGLCKYAGIPQKWGGTIEEDVRFYFPDGSDCTMLDIYEAMASATTLAINDGLKPYSKRILDLEEGIIKVSRNPASWKKYDWAGTVSWSQNKPNV